MENQDSEKTPTMCYYIIKYQLTEKKESLNYLNKFKDWLPGKVLLLLSNILFGIDYFKLIFQEEISGFKSLERGNYNSRTSWSCKMVIKTNFWSSCLQLCNYIRNWYEGGLVKQSLFTRLDVDLLDLKDFPDSGLFDVLLTVGFFDDNRKSPDDDLLSAILLLWIIHLYKYIYFYSFVLLYKKQKTVVVHLFKFF